MRCSEPVPDWIEEQALQVKERLDCRREFDLRQTSEVTTPCLVGIRRPTVLLPEEQAQIARREELPAILMHETAHVKSRDLPWNAALHGLVMLFWFHPLAWRIRLAHADACDAVADTVAADEIEDVARYIRTLARLAIQMHDRTPDAALAMAHTSNVRQRIEAIQRKLFRARLSRTRVLSAVALAAIAVVLLGGLALTQAEVEPKAVGTETEALEPEVRREQLVIHATEAATGKPLEGVEIRFSGWVGGEKYTPIMKTDEKGIAIADWDAGAEITTLWMTCTRSRFVPIHYVWKGDQQSAQVPEELHLYFQPGHLIGGIVQDELGRPIEGAKVRIYKSIDWPDGYPGIGTCTEPITDAEGRWTWDGAPEDLRDVRVSITHADYLENQIGLSPGGDVVYVLKRGATIRGRVVAEDGQPIEGALVRFGNDRYLKGMPETATDSLGRFELKNCKSGMSALTVQGEGYSPALIEIVAGQQEDAGEFRLSPGRTMRIRVVDNQGKPIPGAVLHTDTWRGYRTLKAKLTTDDKGRMRWDSAPKDTVLCDILKREYMNLRKTPLKASDEEQVMTLLPPLDVSGRVTDAETDRPIPKVEIRHAYLELGKSEPDAWAWSDDPAVYQDGSYQYEFEEPGRGRYVLQAAAEGYLPVMSRPLTIKEGAVTLNFALEPGSGVAGIVLSPSGEPAVNAQVGLGTAKHQLSLKNGRLLTRMNRSSVVRTDETGRFAIPQPGEEPYLLIAVHDAGYAELTRGQFDASQEMRLQRWCRIEGQVRVGGEPDANRRVSFIPPPNARGSTYVWSRWYRTTTDSEGRFLFDRLPAGPGTISRDVVSVGADGGRRSTHGWQQEVGLAPGSTLTMTIGGTGRRVVGSIALDREPDVEVDWKGNTPVILEEIFTTSSRVAGDAAEMLVPTSPTSLVPSHMPGSTPTPSLGSDEVHVKPDSPKYPGAIDSVGRFEVVDVPPGKYRLTVSVDYPRSEKYETHGKTIGKGTHVFTIEPLKGAGNEDPLDLGVITATLHESLEVGVPAPDFTAEKLSGGQLRLSDLRGKYVLLNFWSTLDNEVQVLREIHQQFGDDPRFVLLSLSCTNPIETPRAFVAARDLKWLHAHARENHTSHAERDFTVRARPTSFLISPDGRVLARELRGTAMQEAVEAVLDGETSADGKGAAEELTPRYNGPSRPKR
jgi:peroxiredoxin